MRNDFKVGQRVRRIGYADVGTVTDVDEDYVTVDFDGPGVKQGYFPASTVERIAAPELAPSPNGGPALFQTLPNSNITRIQA